MPKGRPVKQYHVDEYIGTEFINNLENILNDRYRQGWKFIRIHSLKVGEYNVLYEKIDTCKGL